MSKLKAMQQAQKDKFDNLNTPINCIEPLRDLLVHKLNLLRPGIAIWECCDVGNSYITKYFLEQKFKVHSSDIRAPLPKTNCFNKYTFQWDFLGDMLRVSRDKFIITNPPYSLKDKFITRAVEYMNGGGLNGFAFLLPISCLEGINRHSSYKKANDLNFSICFASYDKRVNFTQNKSNYFGCGWLIVYKQQESVYRNYLEFLHYKT
ncbi:hypothetical protein A9K75_07785 [Campylobacter fetus subsp. testudinum]|uniref:hypothetical protein n=1 Tax=Campylobacter fetus TaxID=196 RepID=UPI000818B484|nr:hypothetical protein [Campylobacter fetus]OCR99219.1 hypothetical protein A9K75_07785 [Campylobacter fetus subsp. testudinum]